MFVGWAILSPLSKNAGWAPGPVGDMTTGARGWILWISLAIMSTDSLVSLVPVVSELVTKKLLRDPLRAAVDEALSREGDVFIQRLSSTEAREAFNAFLSKKK